MKIDNEIYIGRNFFADPNFKEQYRQDMIEDIYEKFYVSFVQLSRAVDKDNGFS